MYGYIIFVLIVHMPTVTINLTERSTYIIVIDSYINQNKLQQLIIIIIIIKKLFVT